MDKSQAANLLRELITGLAQTKFWNGRLLYIPSSSEHVLDMLKIANSTIADRDALLKILKAAGWKEVQTCAYEPPGQ